MIRKILYTLTLLLLATQGRSATLSSANVGNFFVPDEALEFTFDLGASARPAGDIVRFDLRAANGQLLQTRTLNIKGKTSADISFEPPPREGFYVLEAYGENSQIARSTLGVLSPANPEQKPDAASRFGTVAHLKHMNSTDREQMLNLIQRAGMGWIREGFLWHEMEPVQGQWNTAGYDDLVERSLRHGIAVLPVLCFGTPWAAIDQSLPSDKARLLKPRAEPWQNYVRKMVERYGDRLNAWEIWNEPNLKSFWLPEPNAEAFADTMRQATEVIRQIAPQDTILTAGFSPTRSFMPDAPSMDEALFVRELVAAEPVPFDAIGYHPYTVFHHNVSNERTEMLFLNNLDVAVEGLQGTVDTPDAYPLWLTEMGISTIPRIIDPYTAAGYSALTLTLALSRDNVEKIILYNFRDVGNDWTEKEHMFGLLHHDYTPKPGYFAVRNFIRLLDGAGFDGRTQDDGVVTYSFTTCEGGRVDVLWAANEPRRIVLPEGVNEVIEVTGAPYPVNVENGAVVLEVGIVPLYLKY